MTARHAIVSFDAAAIICHHTHDSRSMATCPCTRRTLGQLHTLTMAIGSSRVR